MLTMTFAPPRINGQMPRSTTFHPSGGERAGRRPRFPLRTGSGCASLPADGGHDLLLRLLAVEVVAPRRHPPLHVHLDDRGPVDGHWGAGTRCPGEAERAAPDPFEDGPVTGPANAGDLLRPVGKDAARLARDGTQVPGRGRVRISERGPGGEQPLPVAPLADIERALGTSRPGFPVHVRPLLHSSRLIS